MSHTITFYNDWNDGWLVSMINQGFSPMKVSEEKDEEYFKRFEGEHRFWSFCLGRWTEDYQYFDLCIGAPDNVVTDWDGVAHWLNTGEGELPLIKAVRCVPESADMYDRRMERMLDEKKQEYMYSERVVDGVFYAEIIKPEDGQVEVAPYTVVIEEWKEDKIQFMFSSICSIPSFGRLYPKDREFIVSLWKYKNMGMEFELQRIIDMHVEAVKSGYTHEPVVYRKSMGAVIDQRQERQTRVGQKRKKEEAPNGH